MTSRRRVASGLALTCFALAGASGALEAQATAPTAEVPVLLTSCGQSPGPERVKFFLNRLNLEHEFLAQATAEDLVTRQRSGHAVKTLIVVTGASLKGMGAAGVSMPQELARTAALIEEARRQGIKLIGAHVEGMARRAQGAAPGDNSDELSIDAVMPISDFMIVRKDGDEDRRFTVISENRKIPLILFEKNMEMGDVLTRVFGG